MELEITHSTAHEAIIRVVSMDSKLRQVKRVGFAVSHLPCGQWSLYTYGAGSRTRHASMAAAVAQAGVFAERLRGAYV